MPSCEGILAGLEDEVVVQDNCGRDALRLPGDEVRLAGYGVEKVPSKR